MGAGASTSKPLSALTAEEVASFCCSLGAAYVQYSEVLISNGVDGTLLSSLKTEADIKQCIDDVGGITNNLHKRNLVVQLSKLLGLSGGTPSSAATPSSNTSHQNWAAPNIVVGDRITLTPRAIMAKLFEIQGIKIDPSEIEPAIAKIKDVVGSGFGDGIDRYDCFINYRVASDQDLAEKLYLYLKTAGVHAYLDKKCLKDGMKWKEGFLHGLTNSRSFIALISSGGLARVRDTSQDHTFDNVLLEYETALKVMECTGNGKYICPVHVGSLNNGGVLTKFTEFSPNLYPDSITAIAAASAPPVSSSPAPIAPKTFNNKERLVPDDDEPAMNEEPAEDTNLGVEREGETMITCYGCGEDMGPQEVPAEGGVVCQWPGHEGDRDLEPGSEVYRCPEGNGCEWAVCSACWLDVHQQPVVDEDEANADNIEEEQPFGTISRYNEEYYCEVLTVAVESVDGGASHRLKLSFNLRGDGSLGALQAPSLSKVIVGEHNDDGGSQEHLMLTKTTIKQKDEYQIQGILYFDCSDSIEAVFSQRVAFEYGAEGYSETTIFVPTSTYVGTQDIPVCSNGHKMIPSLWRKDGYEYGYTCNKCRCTYMDARWVCPQCQDDYCFTCDPAQVKLVKCAADHYMNRVESNPYPKYKVPFCDECRRSDIVNEDGDEYHCKQCNYDLCVPCAQNQLNSE